MTNVVGRGTPWCAPTERRSFRASGQAPTGATGRFALALALLMLLAWAACGGGGNVVHLAGTPPGTYKITITGTDTQAHLTQTTTVNLTVNP